MYITMQRLASFSSMFQIKSSEGWKNPPAAVRIALVASVFAALGVMGGLYLNLLPWLRYDPLAAEIVGAVLFAFGGAWFEARQLSADGRAVNFAVRDERVHTPRELESVL